MSACLFGERRMRRRLAEKEISMSVAARLDTLTERLQALETAIAEERRHAALDDIRLLDLKRRRLAIKDEIVALRQDPLDGQGVNG